MDAWLKCEVSAGQFESEAAVRITEHQGEQFELFAPIQDVRPDSGELDDEWRPGMLAVDVLDSLGDRRLVYLPGPTISNGQSVTVRADQLSAGQVALRV